MDEMLIHVLITFKEVERKLRYSKCPRIQSHQSVCKRPIYPVSLFKTRKMVKLKNEGLEKNLSKTQKSDLNLLSLTNIIIFTMFSPVLG